MSNLVPFIPSPHVGELLQPWTKPPMVFLDKAGFLNVILPQ